jgi:hypothetical protein
MEKLLRTFAGSSSIARLWVFVFVLLVAVRPSGNAEELKKARVSQVIQDVRLLESNAAQRPAAVNDNVDEDTAVRTGTSSRTELTFTDLTITRLGENTIFSFKAGTRELNLSGGAVLVQVPPKGSAVKISTAAVTAAISGGTALFSKGPPTKFMVLEGTGTFYPAGRPEDALTLHGGEMVMMTADGQITRPTKFNVALAYKTSKLINSFPALPNEDLIMAVIEEQAAASEGPPSPPPRDPIDTTDLAIVATPTTPASTLLKFGPLSVITSPDPYVITSGTTINTDPTITTNGLTALGKIYRGPAQDGSPSDYLFGSTSSFDAIAFSNPSANALPIAVFKFAHLQLTGDPTVSVPSGATTHLGLVSVGAITTGAPGGTLTFAGIDRLLIATQNGSITLGPEIAFSGIPHLDLYARGTGSNLTMASPISGGDVVHLNAEGMVQINANISANDFRLISGGDFVTGTGLVTATSIDIQSLSNITIDSSKFPDVAGGSFNLNAAGTLAITITGGTYGRDSLTAQGQTINLTSAAVVALDFLNATVSFTAGTGGINAPNVDFTGSGAGLNFISAGSITAHSITTGGLINGTIAANGGSLSLTGDLLSGAVSALTDINVGGNATAQSLNAGGVITVGGTMRAIGSITAGGDITADTVQISSGGITTPGNLIAGSGGIHPFVISPGGAALQATATVATITSPNGIDFSGNQFLGIDGLSSGGRLTVNANSITFDPASGVASANFNGADAAAFGSGSPPNGGDGGVFIVNTTGDITANNGADITATTGLNSAAGVFSGAGGSVTLHSSGGMVTVNDTIQVSSDDSPNQRQSASGGNISITSGKTTGIAINVSSSAQLLALLNAVAPGPGGKITILATSPASNSSINVNGTVQADRGTVDIEHAGDNGQINLTNATLRADIVKVGAFGTNGTLNIGGGTLSADTTLKLYAPGSSGTINFIADVTLSGASAKIIAGDTVNIFDAVIVTIGGVSPASVFTNHANYTGFGGNGSRTGTFAGAGATNPQPLSSAPPFGP